VYNKLKTYLYDRHLELGAKIVDFHGYLMPVSYKSIVDECKAVRNNVGIFDVSHMGQIIISGINSKNFLQNITVNNLNKIKEGQVQYNLICNQNGGIMDDVLVYNLGDKYMIVPNASNTVKIFNWLLKNKIENISITNKSDEYSLIAIQGPNSRELLLDLFKRVKNLNYYNFINDKYGNKNILISRTGYTGELGYEVLGSHEVIRNIWDTLIDKKVIPCGLGSRDILRIEMKYCLYGNDISEEINPVEAGLNWVVCFNKENFIGIKEILNAKNNKTKIRFVSFIMDSKSIPRKGYRIYSNNELIGTVSSGTISPSLNAGIGLGFINKSYSLSKFEIEIRNQMCSATILDKPFLTKTSLKK